MSALPARSTAMSPRTLLVAATGGHLEQLFRLRERLNPTCGETVWVTHDDPQSRSLLAAESVRTIPYIPPRGYLQAARATPLAWQLLRRRRFDRVISTGAGIAIPFLSVARTLQMECHYIESAARADGPSLTGRIAARLPGVHLYTQYERWARGHWRFRGSLFDRFSAVQVEPSEIRRVVVTLGTIRTYEFSRAVARLRVVIPQVVGADADILWQVGITDGTGLPGEVRANVANAALRDRIAEADLVIAHSGIGSAITALELGKRPVLLPRRYRYAEHVDDHQQLIAGELARRGLAVTAEADEVTAADLLTAVTRQIVVSDAPQPFRLDSVAIV